MESVGETRVYADEGVADEGVDEDGSEEEDGMVRAWRDCRSDTGGWPLLGNWKTWNCSWGYEKGEGERNRVSTRL